MISQPASHTAHAAANAKPRLVFLNEYAPDAMRGCIGTCFASARSSLAAQFDGDGGIAEATRLVGVKAWWYDKRR
jgi:hypothetical protein